MHSPETKRKKLDTEMSSIKSDIHISSILSNDLLYVPEYGTFFVSYISDRKKISSLLTELCTKIPMQKYSFLKRVRNNEILLYRDNDYITLEKNENSTNPHQRFLISKGISQDTADILTENIKISEAPIQAPILRWQYDIVSKVWPCKFHQNKNLEIKFENKEFLCEELTFHSTLFQILNSLKIMYGKECAVAVDSITKKIVAIGMSNIVENPLQHSTMVLIDNVAKSQNGGILHKNKKCTNRHYTECGIDLEIYNFISESYKSIKLGAQLTSSNIGLSQIEASDDNNLSKYGPYLCTGYDIYLTKEPCIMCAMALTHSRARRIFFIEEISNGAVKTLIKLHTIKHLNHHFEVYKINVKEKL